MGSNVPHMDIVTISHDPVSGEFRLATATNQALSREDIHGPDRETTIARIRARYAMHGTKGSILSVEDEPAPVVR